MVLTERSNELDMRQPVQRAVLILAICFVGLMLMGVLLNAAVNAGKRKRLAGDGFE